MSNRAFSWSISLLISLPFDRIDIIYESVGGATFETCVNHLAVKGVLIVIGAVSQYMDQSAWDTSKGTISPTPFASCAKKLL